MAEENKEIELIRELIRATEEGRVTWRPTAKIDEFTASFRGHFSALISKQDNGECHLRIVDEDGRELLHITDDSLGRAADSLFVPPGGMATRSSLLGALPKLVPKPVSWLFDLARRSGFKVDKAIDEILQGLKSA